MDTENIEIPVSDIVSAAYVRPRIKKGYYPAQLVGVKIFKDKEGNVKECKYGTQLILNFAIFKPDADGTPTELMTFKIESEDSATTEHDVILSKFVYYQYKNVKTNEYVTAATANSQITKTFVALGWTFNPKDTLKAKEFIGNWVEVNVDDYEKVNEDGSKTKLSTIKDINVYEGKKPIVSYNFDGESQ